MKHCCKSGVAHLFCILSITEFMSQVAIPQPAPAWGPPDTCTRLLLIESFRPRAAELRRCSCGWIWSPPWHISPGALLFQVSAGARALHFNEETGKSLPQRAMGQMFVLAVRLAAWFLLHTHRFRRRWDRLCEGGCRLGGACQHSWQHLSLCLASQVWGLRL